MEPAEVHCPSLVEPAGTDPLVEPANRLSIHFLLKMGPELVILLVPVEFQLKPQG